MPFISILTPCYNEEENVEEVYRQVKQAFSCLPGYTYEHLFIDNASKDQTVSILREIANQDNNVKVIVNVRNFGHVRSPYHGLFQTKGDAVIGIVADLQDPPELIPELIKKWEQGYKVVLAVKQDSQESRIMFSLRRMYYRLLASMADTELVEDFTGFGLYDREVVEQLRTLDDPYPYFRGLIAELGYERALIYYHQPARKRGITKTNFYILYDMAMLGMTNHSKVPLRLATMLGFFSAAVSLLVALIYLIYKLVYSIVSLDSVFRCRIRAITGIGRQNETTCPIQRFLSKSSLSGLRQAAK